MEDLNCNLNDTKESLFREKERQDETQFTTKIAKKTSLGPNYWAVVTLLIK
jgi:hypothetical protein